MIRSNISGIFYKDFDLSFRKHPVTKKLIIKKNDEAVKQALKNLILTNLFERPFRPLFGSDITKTLFENYDPITESNLETYIRTAITNYEPRVIIIDINIFADPDGNELSINILFRTKNSTDPSELTVIVDRIR